ncbi:MAG: RsmB/NOP family class I SAM-dependent RNA methyltransferase [Sulfolobales archaeon]|nr:RsmB/NOP family class I SAM-dependent RNA methyltransferase [Sulfolobales archaeon]MCX8208190.1 RsmB/NOP family class I SAM-dependent RNA methyltransferase [Sulfolobales archaeon]MDW8010615.1 RsmB/NOP family class I SAM-dependent RNA methyltransferase [Sulfolobales archaeon]
MKEPYRVEWVDVAALIDAVLRAEAVKPVQQAKRDAFRAYGVLGTRKDPPLTAIFYSIMLRLGLLDRVIQDLTGVRNPLLLDPRLRAALRVFTYLELYAKDRVAYSRKLECLKRTASWLTSKSHPYVGMWFVDVVKGLSSYAFIPKSVEDELIAKYLLPPWYVKKVFELVGEEEGDRVLRALAERPKISVRVNVLKTTVQEVVEKLRSGGKNPEVSQVVPTVIKFSGPYNFDKSELFRKGMIVVQEEPAALASLVLNPKPGEVVVDLAAAPGGKTEHMGELMGNRGVIHAFDVDGARMRRLEELVRRAGVSIVKTYVRDGREAPRLLGEGVADKVLVDPPCTSDGTLAKNPDLRWRLVESDVAKLSQLQYELLKAAVKLVRPGGYVLYTTCTLLREENEDVIAKILEKERGKVKLVPLEGPYGAGFLPGTMRVWPHIHKTIGFFYALLQKV